MSDCAHSKDPLSWSLVTRARGLVSREGGGDKQILVLSLLLVQQLVPPIDALSVCVCVWGYMLLMLSPRHSFSSANSNIMEEVGTHSNRGDSFQIARGLEKEAHFIWAQ